MPLADAPTGARSSSRAPGACGRSAAARRAMAGGDARPTLVSQRFAVVIALGMAAGLAIIAFVAFYIPHARLRRDYAAATCTEQSAVPGCSLECRVANVTAPEFPADASGLIARDGIGHAPCESAVECADGEFSCRFKVVATAPEVVLAVRKEPGAFSLGFVIFMALAGVVIVLLCMWLCADCMKYFGLKNEKKLGAVVFLPPGIELVDFTRASRRRWPNVDTRGLDFASMVTERPDQFSMTVRRVLSNACKPEMRGVIFVVKANGRTDEQVLEAVPQDWFRVLVLPPLEVITSQFVAAAIVEPSDTEVGQPEPQTPAGASLSTTPMTVSTESQPDLTRRHAALGPGFQERNPLLEAQTTYRELARLSREDAGLFDYVHSAIRANDLTNYPQLVRAVCGPVIGLRTATLAWGMRIHRALHGFATCILQTLVCARDEEGKQGDVEQSSFGVADVPSPASLRDPHSPRLVAVSALSHPS